MKLVRTEIVIAKGAFAHSENWTNCRTQIESAIQAVVWPYGAKRFTICSDRGRGRGQGNGVVPIKHAFLNSLKGSGWSIEERRNPLRFDAFLSLPDGRGIGLERETGNISSSHRSINRILKGHLDGVLIAGALVLPSRALYRFLTDRIGNYEEIEPYFPIWRIYPWQEGVLAVFSVEHDAADPNIPRITKGTNGRAID